MAKIFDGKYYAGIGSRKCPPHILTVMSEFAKYAAELNYCVNSGGADGADTAFEHAALSVSGCCQIFLPWPGFNGHKNTDFCDVPFQNPKPEAFDVAANIHPNWKNLKHSIRCLVARNMHQVLGWNLNNPVDFIICWTPDGAETKQQYSQKTGGTGSAIALADSWGIPVFNLFNPSRLDDVLEFIEKTTWTS